MILPDKYDLAREVYRLKQAVEKLRQRFIDSAGSDAVMDDSSTSGAFVLAESDDAHPTARVLGEGPGIDIVDGGEGGLLEVGIGGDKVLLYKSDGTPVAEYDKDSAGLTAALAAAASGNVVMLPAGTISGDHTVPAGVTLEGIDRQACILSGVVTLGNGSCLTHLSVTRSISTAAAEFGVVGPGSGNAKIIGCALSVTQSGAGTGYGLRVMGGDVDTYGCYLFGSTAGVGWAGAGLLRSHQDDNRAATPFTGIVYGFYTFDTDLEGWQADSAGWSSGRHTLSHTTADYYSSPGSLKIVSIGTGSVSDRYEGPLLVYKDISITVHTDDVVSMRAKLSTAYMGEHAYLKLVYTDGSTLILDGHPDLTFDWTLFSTTVPAGDNGKVTSRVYFGELLTGWDDVYDSTMWFDDINIAGQINSYGVNAQVFGAAFLAAPTGIPGWSDRAAYDAATYPLRHTNDTDVSTDALHHTIGDGATQAASGAVAAAHIADTANPHNVTTCQLDFYYEPVVTGADGSEEFVFSNADIVVAEVEI